MYTPGLLLYQTAADAIYARFLGCDLTRGEASAELQRLNTEAARELGPEGGQEVGRYLVGLARRMGSLDPNCRAPETMQAAFSFEAGAESPAAVPWWRRLYSALGLTLPLWQWLGLAGGGLLVLGTATGGGSKRRRRKTGRHSGCSAPFWESATRTRSHRR